MVLDGRGAVEINQVLFKKPHSEVVDCYGAVACVETVFNPVNICNLKMKAFIKSVQTHPHVESLIRSR